MKKIISVLFMSLVILLAGCEGESITITIEESQPDTENVEVSTETETTNQIEEEVVENDDYDDDDYDDDDYDDDDYDDDDYDDDDYDDDDYDDDDYDDDEHGNTEDVTTVSESTKLDLMSSMFTAETYEVYDTNVSETILSIYLAKDINSNVVQVFYEFSSSNTGYSTPNSLLVQFDPLMSTIKGVEVIVDNSTYVGTSPNSGVAFSEIDFSFLIGTDQNSSLVHSELDVLAGVSTRVTMQGLIDSLTEVIDYQAVNKIG